MRQGIVEKEKCILLKYICTECIISLSAGKTMVREIMKDVVFLSQKAQPAAMDDLPVAEDLPGFCGSRCTGKNAIFPPHIMKN